MNWSNRLGIIVNSKKGKTHFDSHKQTCWMVVELDGVWIKISELIVGTYKAYVQSVFKNLLITLFKLASFHCGIHHPWIMIPFMSVYFKYNNLFVNFYHILYLLILMYMYNNNYAWLWLHSCMGWSEIYSTLHILLIINS